MPIVLSPNMNLPVPVVGQEQGPQYATDINGCMAILDNHNHTPGSGVSIPSNAINFNSDLPAMNNRTTGLKSATFTAQGAPLAGVSPDIGALYVAGLDLYYNDINGNQVRITQGGSVTGSAGSITGLSAPATASYSSGTSTFTWQSNINTAAAMDGGPITIREIAAAANGITINSPVALGADYDITLPSGVPASNSFITSNTSGNWGYVSQTHGITQGMLQLRATGTTVAAGGYAESADSASFVTSMTSYVDITNLSVTITTTGRPVVVGIKATTGDNISNIQVEYVNIAPNTPYITAGVNIVRGATIIGSNQFGSNKIMVPDAVMFFPPNIIEVIDPVAAGTYTYKAQARVITTGTSTISVSVNECCLYAYET